MTRRNSGFRTGSGCYTCTICGKRTRDTGEGEGDRQHCHRCDELAMAANYITDNQLSREEARKHAEGIARTLRGGGLTEAEWARMQWAIRE